ncbi:MAG: amidohydrolase family protein [Vicinamibacterales bacterium]
MRGLNWLVAVGALALASVSLVAQQGAGQGQGTGRGGGRGNQPARVAIQPGQECPPGMTQVRYLSCQAPEKPPPSIVDYRPKSTVVAAAHLVPKAKYPVIDIHNHSRITAENVEQMVKEMDDLNLRVLVNLTAGSGAPLKESVDFIRNSQHKDRFRVFANVRWTGAGTPEWRDREVAALKQAFKDGALGLKIVKGLGLSDTRADGSRLKIDDPDLDPIWQACADANVPVLIHTADPEQFFAPVDMHNERWLELGIFPNRAYPPDRFPSFETLMTERDNMFRRNPKTRFIAAHFGWHGNDFGRAAKMLDTMANVYLEVGAVLYEFGRQPRASREFFTKYQDRVLFGKDAYEKSEFPYYWRVFETSDEYFDYYRDYHAFWKLSGLGLPDAVLKKLYYKNALKITPGLPQTGWPQ